MDNKKKELYGIRLHSALAVAGNCLLFQLRLQFTLVLPPLLTPSPASALPCSNYLAKWQQKWWRAAVETD